MKRNETTLPLRYWPYIRVWGSLLLTWATLAAPFAIAIFVFGAPWWAMYFLLVPQTLACELLKQFWLKRGWVV